MSNESESEIEKSASYEAGFLFRACDLKYLQVIIKVRALRPFPSERLVLALKGKKAIGVIDRNVCFGWGCGTLYMELNSALRINAEFMPVLSFIDGLANSDITIEHIDRAITIIEKTFDIPGFWLKQFSFQGIIFQCDILRDKKIIHKCF